MTQAAQVVQETQAAAAGHTPGGWGKGVGASAWSRETGWHTQHPPQSTAK